MTRIVAAALLVTALAGCAQTHTIEREVAYVDENGEVRTKTVEQEYSVPSTDDDDAPTQSSTIGCSFCS